jgi:hypothetical protein
MKMKFARPVLRLFTLVAALLATSRAPAADVTLHFLDGTSAVAPTGVSWGVPFAQGVIKKDAAAFTLLSPASPDHPSASMPLQSWPLAYWPDGSIKWMGFATTTTPGQTGNLTLTSGIVVQQPAQGQLKVTDAATYIQINTGPLTCVIDKAGDTLVDWMAVNGTTVAQKGQLVCILQNGPETNPEDSPPPREKYLSTIKKVTLEQSGPVRATVKIEGMHKGVTSGREWLPFTVRLYFYSGETSVRLVHTIVFDGNQEKDFVRGLGIEFAVPMREVPANRHVAFSGGNDGLWDEPLQPGGGNAQQEANQPIGGRPDDPTSLNQNAIWDDYKLNQPTPDGFTITKRTNPQSTWLYAVAGKRASGFAFAGDTSGGLGVSVKNFWQSFPAELEVNHASTPVASLVAWLWSPDATEMDMRHYDTRAHGLNTTYEDVQPGFSTAYGIGRTSELTLYPSNTMPERPELVAQAQSGTELPMIAATPDYIHSTGVFGFWSVQDRSTPFKSVIEDGLDNILAFYEKEVDERSWYGFWQFGDFMHSYSAARHDWNYDWGGHAWDNTELGVPIWLWYSYLRTGRADLFRLAEAHTRNTSETVVYHLGPMKGLGTRHNVIKWGDGAKEARVAQSTHWRFYYYLTTDERVGDIMTDELDADVAVAKYDSMREAMPITAEDTQRIQNGEFAGRIRVGPDWFALASNWMAAWERTGDTKWRDRILVGVKDMAKMPYGIRTGTNLVMGWNPVTADLYSLADVAGQYNLATIQGGGELGNELSTLLDDPDWQRIWSQYCRLLAAPAAVVTQDNTTHNEGDQAQYYGGGGGNPDSIPRLAAFAYHITKNPAFATEAINTGLLNIGGANGNPRVVDGPNALSPVTDSSLADTNGDSQRSLATIEVLELCADQLPMDAAAANRGGARGGGRRGGGGGPAGAPAGGRGAGPAAPAGSGN